MLVLAAVVLLGDQRMFTVVAATPADGDEVPLTVREVSVTFNAEPDQASVEDRLTLDPPVAGSIRWRGKTLVYTFTSPLSVGTHRVAIAAGASGRASQTMSEPFSLTFQVREPGIAVVVHESSGDRLVAVRGTVTQTLLSAQAIDSIAVSPDGAQIAVISQGASGAQQEKLDPATADQGPTILALVASDGSSQQAISDSPDVLLGGVDWAADASSLLVVRRDRLPLGQLGVPRVWLMRLNGDWVGPIDPSGVPSINPVWSPDAQSVAYISPSDGKLIVQNLSTHAIVNLGQPRGSTPAWSPDSKQIAFESVPPEGATTLLQQVTVKSLDGTVNRAIGGPGEVRSQPVFLDSSTLLGLRRTLGADTKGTELLFESLTDGSLLRSILLAPGQDVVLNWRLDPTHKKVVYAVRSGSQTTTLVLDLESGRKTPLGVAGDDPRWLP